MNRSSGAFLADLAIGLQSFVAEFLSPARLPCSSIQKHSIRTRTRAGHSRNWGVPGGHGELPSWNGGNTKSQINCPFCLERFHYSQCPPRPASGQQRQPGVERFHERTRRFGQAVGRRAADRGAGRRRPSGSGDGFCSGAAPAAAAIGIGLIGAGLVAGLITTGVDSYQAYTAKDPEQSAEKWTEAAGNGILTVLGAIGAPRDRIIGRSRGGSQRGRGWYGSDQRHPLVRQGKPGRARLASGPRVWKPVPKCRQRPRHPYRPRHSYQQRIHPRYRRMR